MSDRSDTCALRRFQAVKRARRRTGNSNTGTRSSRTRTRRLLFTGQSFSRRGSSGTSYPDRAPLCVGYCRWAGTTSKAAPSGGGNRSLSHLCHSGLRLDPLEQQAAITRLLPWRTNIFRGSRCDLDSVQNAYGVRMIMSLTQYDPGGKRSPTHL